MMRLFQIDFDVLVLQLLPSFLRQKRLFALARAMVAPIGTLYERFMRSRDEHNYALTHNGQVCYLRAALNDAFGTTHFDIFDFDDDRGEWLYAKSEDLPEQLYVAEEGGKAGVPIPILSDEARLNLQMNYFVVQVPHHIYATQLDRVRMIVEQYKILSKQAIYTPIG